MSLATRVKGRHAVVLASLGRRRVPTAYGVITGSRQYGNKTGFVLRQDNGVELVAYWHELAVLEGVL